MSKLYTKKTWIDEVLSGAERYRIADNGNVTLNDDVIIQLKTSVVTPGDAVSAAVMNNIENGIDAIDTRVENLKYALNRVLVLTSGSTYTPTAGTRAILVECIGGGGAGGGAATSSSNCSLGGGGGSGAFSASLITTILSSFAYSIGAGGTAGAAGAPGNAGGDTSFNAGAVLAKGGAGGAVLAAGTSLLTQEGAAGGSASAGAGNLKLDGADGGWGVRLSASAGHSGDGGAAPHGGGSVGGANATLTAGSAGKLYGGGGSGAFTATTSRAGGAGAQGMIRIWEFF